MSYETPLRLNISLRNIFSESASFGGMEKYYESGLMQILQMFEIL